MTDFVRTCEIQVRARRLANHTFALANDRDCRSPTEEALADAVSALALLVYDIAQKLEPEP